MRDLLIIETGNGGDIVLKGKDLEMVEGIENMPYLMMFGGSSDWWGNDFATRPDEVWSSKTEQILNTTALNSAGRIKIQQAVIDDLAPLKKLTAAQIDVDVSISENRVEILINIGGSEVRYIWNPNTLFLTYKV